MCGDGQQRSFSGSTNMTFNGVQSCRVQAGSVKGLLYVDASATYTCTVSDTAVACRR